MGKLTIILGLLSLLLVTEQVRGDVTRARAEEALRRQIFQNYDKQALPNKMTHVNITGFVIVDLDMHEKEHSVDIQGWLKQAWNDPRLKWNSDDHDGITVLALDPHEIWKPDFAVYNSISAQQTDLQDLRFQPLVYPTGNLIYVPANNYHFRCKMDLTYWPHDTHNCTLILGSWVRSGVVMDVVLTNESRIDTWETESDSNEVTEQDATNTTIMDWMITKTAQYRWEKFYSCCEEPYISIRYSLLLTRNAPAFAWTVKMPAVCLCLLTLVLFILPPGAGEKVIFGGICLILNFLYLSYTSDSVNYAPNHTPLIVQLVGQQVVMVLVSVFMSAAVVRMARVPHVYGLPSFLKSPVLALARFLCLGNYANLNTESPSSGAELGDGDVSKSGNGNTNEWVILAAVVDRLALILYLAFCIIILIRFNSVL